MRIERALAKFVCAALIAIVFAARPSIAAADVQAGPASEFMRAVSDDSIRILRSTNLTKEERDARFRALLEERFDMPFISRFALGRYWQTATMQQREAYTSTFTEYVLQIYSARLRDYAGETLRVISERQAGERDIVVNTRIERPSREPLEAQWRVRDVDGSLRIIDVVLAGVSMIVTQRDEFAAIVQRQNVDGLISAMRARAEELRKQG